MNELTGKIILQTDRLILRELTLNDFNSLCRILQDKDVMYAYEHAFSDEEALQWLNNQLSRYNNYGFGLWAVILKESGEMIGQCGLSMQDCNGKQVLEVGYLFEKAFWHQGYAIEAAIACKNYAFQTLKALEVYSIIRDNNISSQNVALRNGMTICGGFTKHYYNVCMPHLIFRVINISYCPLAKTDLENLFKLTNNEAVTKYMRFNKHININETEVLLNEYLAEKSFTITQLGDFIGIFSFKKDENPSTFSISLFLAEKYWRKGFASQILTYMKNYAKEALNATTLIAYVVEDNISSCKVVMKNGFMQKEILHFNDMKCGLIVYKCNFKENL